MLLFLTGEFSSSLWLFLAFVVPIVNSDRAVREKVERPNHVISVHMLAHEREPLMKHVYHLHGHGRGRQIKYYPCPHCGHSATLIVEIREEIVHVEVNGKRSYYCTHCNHQFKVK